jgi:hypothetical protein
MVLAQVLDQLSQLTGQPVSASQLLAPADQAAAMPQPAAAPPAASPALPVDPAAMGGMMGGSAGPGEKQASLATMVAQARVAKFLQNTRRNGTS